MDQVSRRSLLAGAGAALGAGALSVAPTASAAAVAHQFVLIGSQMRRLGARGRGSAGASTTTVGRLTHSSDPAREGQFYSSGTVLAAHSMLDSVVGLFEIQHFAMTDGTITGSGTVQHNGHGLFTVTGGSGRYAGARGTYVTEQTADHSGTGHARFTFSFE